MKQADKSLAAVVLLTVAVVLVAVVAVKGRSGLRKENERLREELARAQQYVPLHRDTIRDTVEVVAQKVVEVLPRTRLCSLI